jgi:nucleolar protein 56
MPTELVATWFGAFEMDGDRVLRTYLAPADTAALVERMRVRRSGVRVPEEERLLAGALPGAHVTRDRRLVTPSVTLAVIGTAPPTAKGQGIDPALRRAVFLAVAETALAEAWDPSIHVEEAVRSMTDLDSVRNLVGERLVSWSSRDMPPSEEGPEDASRAARSLEEGIAPDPTRAPEEPELLEARRKLARLYRTIAEVRDDLDVAVSAALPRRAPNVSALLGPLLAARMLSQAGGLARLARLPASTVQMLGAEKAFFDHLRGRAPPPRHGLLFLHPTIQGAPRRQRGKLARALAGKVAIAARLDLAGADVRPELKASYEARRAEVRAQAPGPGKPGRGRHVARRTPGAGSRTRGTD